ncbi:MAG TPA: glycerol-3-phosphate dehydrogenase C-terminal domain-containing protein, partial [Pyrinomonadaceae bacterium]
LCSLVGGKLTTYRQLAEECVDLVFDRLNQVRPKCSTADVELPGARNYDLLATWLRADTRFSSPVQERLLRIYGARTEQLLKVCERHVALLEPLNDSSDVIAGEVVFAFEEEMATTLTDCFARRTMSSFNRDLAMGEIEKAAAIAKRFLGWGDERANRDVEEYRHYVVNRKS